MYMVRKGYKVATIEADLYRKALEITKAKTLPEALRRLLPRCIQGYNFRGHLFIRAIIEEITIENVFYIDISGLKIRMDKFAEILVEIWRINPSKFIEIVTQFFSGIRDGSFKVLSKPVVVKVKHPGYFLVDTGATTTVINTALLPPKVRILAMSAGRDVDIQTPVQRIRVAKGIAKISLADMTIEERVFIIDTLSSPHHFMGINTLRRLFGDKILIDFKNARICRMLEI